VAGLHVITPKFEPKLAMSIIEQHKVNFCLFVPTMLAMLMDHPDFDKHDLTSVHNCMYGGAPMSDALLERTLEKLPGWRFVQGYGQTESTGMTTSLDWPFHFGKGAANKRRCTGRPAHGVELRIVDLDGNEVPRGTVGEVVVRGPTVMLGYWRKPELTAETIRDGWLHTGDAARMDEQGFITVVDRYKDMIISGGENVFSREVENAISTHPAIRECAVIGVPDLKWGERIHAVVVLKDGASATLESVVEHCRRTIAGFKCPRSLEIRSAMPISAAGKITKNVLRDEHRDAALTPR
jgi:long-chain acyl-CoA synthetase